MFSTKWMAGSALAMVLAAVGAANADVVVSKKATANMSCSAGVCSPTAKEAVLNAIDLATMLAAGDVTVNTGGIAKDIEVHAPLSWASTSRLTLDAQRSVVLKTGMSVTGTGALTVTTNDGGGKSGEFVIVPEQGSVQFWDLSSSLIIDGQTYTLVGDIKTLAADIAANPSGFYALAKPYDASVDGTYSHSPISTTFTGSFYGLGNAISNLNLAIPSDGSANGLFQIVQTGGRLNSVRLIGIDFKGNPLSAVGGLAAGNVGVINRSSVAGRITISSGEINSGGLVGANFGVLENSHSNIEFVVTGTDLANVGQLVGENDGSLIACYAEGGFVGTNNRSTNFGGLVGMQKGEIQNGYAVTAIKGGRKDCCDLEVGGLVGENGTSSRIKAVYAAGKMKTNEDSEFGGLIGLDGAPAGTTARAYWDLDRGISDPAQGAGNIRNDPGLTGLTTDELRSGLPAGFDPEIWGQSPSINNGYPYLLANPPPP